MLMSLVVVAFAMMLRGGAVRPGRVLVMLGRLRMSFLPSLILELSRSWRIVM
jgi:hypothetical protein